MPRSQQAILASQPGAREQALQSHYKALNPCLAAAVLHARPAEKKSQQMAMSQLVDDRFAEME
ncbi:hypothetical protein [Kaistia terrae]|uniref:Uncharacterized protein n=1 Tax=Kaistia terrae TaxID=537017 RepID=A0ABW0PWD7_9HYPH|nr:hypothetical protein [Kaistia terrae]MCX5576925.1 hypothetical protein [Kaistia terrae]